MLLSPYLRISISSMQSMIQCAYEKIAATDSDNMRALRRPSSATKEKKGKEMSKYSIDHGKDASRTSGVQANLGAAMALAISIVAVTIASFTLAFAFLHSSTSSHLLNYSTSPAAWQVEFEQTRLNLVESVLASQAAEKEAASPQGCKTEFPTQAPGATHMTKDTAPFANSASGIIENWYQLSLFPATIAEGNWSVDENGIWRDEQGYAGAAAPSQDYQIGDVISTSVGLARVIDHCPKLVAEDPMTGQQYTRVMIGCEWQDPIYA